MITKGMDIAAKGMMALLDLNDTTANNLANVNTTGFKKSALVFKSVYDAALYERTPQNDIKFGEERNIGTLSMGSKTHKTLLEFAQGNLERTGNPLDIAIQGDGFFKIQSVDGDISYTRNGTFVINSDKMLVTKDGDYVLDNLSKPITLDMKKLRVDNVHDLVVNEDGLIQTNGTDNHKLYQKIGMFDFRIKSELKSVGNSKFVPKDITTNPEVPAERFSLQQGAIESSNSNTITEMINIINVTRNYETLSKYVKTDGDLLSRAVNLGRLQI